MPSSTSAHTSRTLHRRLQPRASTYWRLGWRNIYVLPTRAGWVMLLLLLVLLVASVNYQLSLGYLLTFLLAGSIAAGVGVAHANLRGIELQAIPPEAVFAGQTVRLQLRLRAPTGGVRHAVFVALGDRPSVRHASAWSGADLQSGGDTLLDLGFTAAQRGRQPLPRVTVQTLFPLGAFRLWSHWQPAEHAWVYPAAEMPSPPLQQTQVPDHGSHALASPHAHAEPDGVRAYQRGDPLRHIVWKKAAQALSTGSDQLVSRNRQSSSTPDSLWLDEAATQLPQLEARLSRLTAWVLQAQQQQLSWGLRMAAGQQLPPATGLAHYRQCMQLLATYSISSQAANQPPPKDAP